MLQALRWSTRYVLNCPYDYQCEAEQTSSLTNLSCITTGFGRYFPNSVRSLAQTTTSQTILKHMGSKCRFCTPEVRNAILELQRQQAAREGLSSGRPRYGSRKIFFQRVWARLHGGVNIEDEFKDSEDAHVPLAQPEDAKLPAIEEPPKRKTRGGASNKNKKAKIEAEATNQVEV